MMENDCFAISEVKKEENQEFATYQVGKNAFSEALRPFIDNTVDKMIKLKVQDSPKSSEKDFLTEDISDKGILRHGSNSRSSSRRDSSRSCSPLRRSEVVLTGSSKLSNFNSSILATLSRSVVSERLDLWDIKEQKSVENLRDLVQKNLEYKSLPLSPVRLKWVRRTFIGETEWKHVLSTSTLTEIELNYLHAIFLIKERRGAISFTSFWELFRIFHGFEESLASDAVLIQSHLTKSTSRSFLANSNTITLGVSAQNMVQNVTQNKSVTNFVASKNEEIGENLSSGKAISHTISSSLKCLMNCENQFANRILLLADMKNVGELTFLSFALLISICVNKSALPLSAFIFEILDVSKRRCIIREEVLELISCSKKLSEEMKSFFDYKVAIFYDEFARDLEEKLPNLLQFFSLDFDIEIKMRMITFFDARNSLTDDLN